MNKRQLVALIQNKANANFTKSGIEEVLNQFMDITTEVVKAGDEVTLTRFGTFTSIVRKSRRSWNAKTKEIRILPAVRTPKFRPGCDFRESVK